MQSSKELSCYHIMFINCYITTVINTFYISFYTHGSRDTQLHWKCYVQNLFYIKHKHANTYFKLSCVRSQNLSRIESAIHSMGVRALPQIWMQFSIIQCTVIVQSSFSKFPWKGHTCRGLLCYDTMKSCCRITTNRRPALPAPFVVW
jgi:hypothetical protein